MEELAEGFINEAVQMMDAKRFKVGTAFDYSETSTLSLEGTILLEQYARVKKETENLELQQEDKEKPEEKDGDSGNISFSSSTGAEGVEVFDATLLAPTADIHGPKRRKQLDHLLHEESLLRHEFECHRVKEVCRRAVFSRKLVDFFVDHPNERSDEEKQNMDVLCQSLRLELDAYLRWKMDEKEKERISLAQHNEDKAYARLMKSLQEEKDRRNNYTGPVEEQCTTAGTLDKFHRMNLTIRTDKMGKYLTCAGCAHKLRHMDALFHEQDKEMSTGYRTWCHVICQPCLKRWKEEAGPNATGIRCRACLKHLPRKEMERVLSIKRTDEYYDRCRICKWFYSNHGEALTHWDVKGMKQKEGPFVCRECWKWSPADAKAASKKRGRKCKGNRLICKICKCTCSRDGQVVGRARDTNNIKGNMLCELCKKWSQ